ncbi:acyltransferase [Leptospira langatensis]|uniref:Acyltransferase n=1 Tax=Leptospira langatensis TaxID=2484983 RepID=A0A5F1ZQK8_9LEPT|nr:acyltransferase [Leptospira langatensis]TGK02820.1 acyltransferase [Leptospira langatensis]TGL39975.1 acyltransferase [Leptospira langatensis]
MKEYFLGIFRSDDKEIAPFNGIRTMCFFMLIYGHMYRSVEVFIPEINPYMRNFLDNGSTCLDMFFSVSGFLIATPLFAELNNKGTINWKFFYIKRFLRIFPPYYAFLALQYFVFIPIMLKTATPEIAAQIEIYKGRIWYDIFYLSDYLKGTMFHGWSLSLEEQFYIIFPLFLLTVFSKVPERFRLTLLVVLTIIPTIYRAIFSYTILFKTTGSESVNLYNTYFYYPFQGHIDSILCGIVFSYIFSFRKHWLEWLFKSGRLGTVLHLCVWAVLVTYTILAEEFKMSFHQIIRYPSFSILWILIFIFTMRKDDPIGKFLSWKVFFPFAKLSYCAYLIHVVAMVPLSRKLLFADGKLEQHEFLLYTIPVGLFVFFCAYFYYLLTERPFTIIKDKLIARYKAKMTSQVFRDELNKATS